MSDSPQPNAADSSAPGGRWKIILALLLIAGLFVASQFLPLKEWFNALRDYVQTAGWKGYVLYIVVYTFTTVCIIPATPMALLAGAVFGLSGGFFLAMAGANLGALSAFLLGRTLLHQRVNEWARTKPRLHAIDSAVSENALKIIVLLRLSPVFPFTLLNYALAVTGAPAAKYALATFVGMLPGTFAFVYLGYLGADLGTASSSTEVRVLQISGLVATLIVTMLITRLAKRKLSEHSQIAEP